jgi:hypothetical protein
MPNANAEKLNRKELDYALLLRELLPTDAARKQSWIQLRKMIHLDYIRPSRWDRFDEISERGQ